MSDTKDRRKSSVGYLRCPLTTHRLAKVLPFTCYEKFGPRDRCTNSRHYFGTHFENIRDLGFNLFAFGHDQSGLYNTTDATVRKR